MPTTRSVVVCAAVGVLGALGVGAGAAHADLPNMAEITWNKVFIQEDGNSQEPSTPDALRQYLNLAHCACSQADVGGETTIRYEIGLTADTNTNRPADVWVGTQCEDETLRPMKCRALKTIGDIDLLVTRPENIEISLYDAINATENTAACQ